MPTDQAGTSQPDTSVDADTRAAYDELMRGPATEPEAAPTPSEATPEPSEAAPTETKPAATDDRPRDEQGRFVKTDEPQKEAPTSAQPAVEAPAAPPPQASVEGSSSAPPTAPPPGWSVKSKAEWDKLPEHIRADIAKREQEVSAGFAEYSGMRPLRRYMDMARQSGTTLEAALERYTSIEGLLRQDPFRAFTQIANNVGITPQQLVAGLQLHLGVGQSNGHAQVPQADGTQSGLSPELLQQWLNPVQQEVSQLKQLLTQQHQAEEARAASALNSTLARFQADPSHRYYENVRTRMAQLIKGEVVPSSGDDMADLQSAYELACWQDPEIRALMIKDQNAKSDGERKQREKDAAEKARQASRSITGSPGNTVNDTDGKSSSGSVEDDARAAYHSVMNSTRV